MRQDSVDSSAGPDLLDPLDPRIYFFNCLGSGAKRSFRILTPQILPGILAMDPITSNLAFLLFIRYVKSQNAIHKTLYKFIWNKYLLFQQKLSQFSHNL